jgi:WD40 repeat protein
MVLAQGEPLAKKDAAREREKTPRVDAYGDPLPAGAIARLGTARWRTGESPLLFSSDGRFAIADSREHKPRFIEVPSGKILREFDILSRGGAFLMPDNKTLIVAGLENEDSLHFLDIATGKELRRFPFDGYPRSWSADGKRLACWHQKQRSDGLGNIRHVAVWDLDSGKKVRRWDTLRGEFSLAPDGKTLAVRNIKDGLPDSEHILLFDLADGKELRRWKSPRGGRFAYSPDGKIIASAEGARVTLWDPATGKPSARRQLSRILPTGKDMPETVVFSRDGHYLAAGCANGALYLWDLPAGKLIRAIADAGQGLPIYVLNFTADGKTLVSNAHLFPSARLWNVADGMEISPAGAKATKVDALTFSPDGKTIAGVGPSDPVSLWDARSGKLLRRFPIPPYLGFNYSGPPVFLPGGKTLALSTFHYLTAWNLDDGKLRYRTKGDGPYDNQTPDVDRQQQLFAQCSLDDNTIVAVYPGEVKEVVGGGRQARMEIRWAMIGLFDIRSGKIVRSFQTKADQFVRQVFLSPDRRTLVGIANQGDVFAWDLAQGVELFRLPPPLTFGGSASFSADGRSLVLTGHHPVANDQKWVVHLYEMASAKKRATVAYQVGPYTHCAVAGDHLLAISQKDKIQLFDLLSAKELGRFTSDGWVECLAFAPDGKTLASGSMDTTALIWDISSLVPALPKIKLSKDKITRCWADLLGNDAKSAFGSIRLMSQAPEQTVEFLKESLHPVPHVPAEKIARLIKQFDSERFLERNQASDELFRLGEAAEAALVDVLKKSVSLETGRRAEEILRKLRQKRTQGPWTLTGEPLRHLRAVEILERIGTSEATALLARLAKGSPYAVLTREAKTSHQRLTMRSLPAP